MDWAATTVSGERPSDSASTLPEKRALDFFRATTAPWISGFLDDAVWNRTVMQMARAIPAVHHASCALAALHEEQISRNTTANPFSSTFSNAPGLAEKQYSKAVSELKQLVSSSNPRTNAIVVSAMLCIHFESLRENFAPAVMHGESAVELLNSTESSAADAVDDGILRAMYQLDLQGSMSIEARAPGLSFHTVMTDTALPDGFHSLLHARDVINAWTSRFIYFMRTTANQYKYRAADKTPHAVVSEAQVYQQCFQKLVTLLFELIHRPNVRLTLREHRALAILRVRITLNAIQSATCLSGQETSYDAFFNDFEEIFTSCTHALYSEEFTKRLWSASIDDGLIYPLYFTAIHCRDGRIRHQALEQLRRLPGAERMWHVKSWIRVVELWLRYEEAVLTTPPEVAAARDVPEYRRVHMAHFKGLEALAPQHPVRVYLRSWPNGMEAHWTEVDYALD